MLTSLLVPGNQHQRVEQHRMLSVGALGAEPVNPGCIDPQTPSQHTLHALFPTTLLSLSPWALLK